MEAETLYNLNDITLNPRFSAICGYTDEDLDTVFAPELGDLDRETIRDWYNGYNWRGTERIYNPFEILLLFFNREFDAYWFGTGSPALDGMLGTSALLSKFDVDDMATEALLFQTGYLTITGPALFLRRLRRETRCVARIDAHPARNGRQVRTGLRQSIRSSR